MPDERPIEFGTDGWRAVVADDFTYENVRAVAQGVANFLRDDQRPIVVAHDIRFSGELFAREVTRVLAANGKRVILIDRPVPTPVASWTVRDRKTAGAIVVTASHNPSEFNGLKYKSDIGGSAAHELIASIQRETNAAARTGLVKQISYAEAQSRELVELVDARPAYMEQIGQMVNLKWLADAGLKILHEPMYGAGQGYISAALQGGKTKVTEIHSERNPSFCGMHPEPIARYMPEAITMMQSGQFDLCIANDGDADRVGIIDERGRYVNQLEVAGLFAMYLLEQKNWRGDIVRSLTSTNMLDALGEKFSVKVHETPVGFPYIGKTFVECDAILAAEESGGFAFRGHLPERDGIVAGLLIAQMIVDYGMKLSKLLERLTALVGPRAYDRHDIRFDRDGYAERKAQVYERMQNDRPTSLAGGKVVDVRDDDGFKFYLEDGAWVLMRMSGTEPLMRIYSEAATKQRVDELLTALEDKVGVRSQPVGAR